jgi:hypothetical protein
MEVKDLFKVVQPRLSEYRRTHGNLQPVCIFVEAVPSTVMAWAANDRPAQGARLLRLWHLLAAAGYESPEMKTLPPISRYLSELFAYSCINMEEAMQLAGVKNEQSALLIMRGSPPMNPAMPLDELAELYQEQLETAKVALLATLPGAPEAPPSQLTAMPTPQPAVVEPASPPALPGVPVGVTSDSKVYTLATLLGAALPLARGLNSDRSKPADRALLRELMGETGVFELSNILDALCGERARSSSTTHRR